MDKSKADQRILVTSRVLWRITWKSLSTVSPVLWKSLVALLQEKRLGKSSWAMCSETVFEPRHFQAAREMGRGNFCIKGTWDFRLKLESNPENRPFWAWLRIYFTTRRDYTQDRQTNWRQNQLRDMVIWIRRCFLKLNGVSNTVWWRLILF